MIFKNSKSFATFGIIIKCFVWHVYNNWSIKWKHGDEMFKGGGFSRFFFTKMLGTQFLYFMYI